MTFGETLLNLTLEYQRTLDTAGSPEPSDAPQDARTPQVIAAEYEQTLKELLRSEGVDGGTP